MDTTFRLFKILLTVCVCLFARTSFAQDHGCTPGYQDNTCIPRLTHAVIPPPVCSTAAGWTTVTSATWIGSGYTTPTCNFQPQPVCSTAAGWTTLTPSSWNGATWSAPNCSFQAQPSCPSGYNETSVPTWNGSSWVGLGCTPQAPPCPNGFSCDAGGVPYALMLGYCGEVSQVTILHIVHYTDSCTPSMAGAVRVNQAGTLDNGNGTLDYWNTPSSFTTTSTQTYRNVAGPAGTVVQTVNLAFGAIQYDPDDCGCDATPQYEGTVGGGSAEGWVFALLICTES